MRYQKKSAISYMFRNFGNLIYVALPVAVAMAFFFNFSAETNLYRDFVLGNLTLDDYWIRLGQSLSVLRFAQCWWQALLTLILLIVTFSLLTIKVGRHMRVGEKTILPFKRTFRILPSMALYIVCMFVAIQVVMLIPLGLTYLLRAINNLAIIIPISFAITMITRILLAYLFAMLLVAFPIKLGENYKFNVAFAYSVRITSKKKLFCRLFGVLYPILRFAVGVVAVLVEQSGMDILLYALFFVSLIMFLPCKAYELYHDSIGGERRDIDQLLFDRR